MTWLVILPPQEADMNAGDQVASPFHSVLDPNTFRVGVPISISPV